MRIVIIDDEIHAINELKYFLKEYEVNIVNTYQDAWDALENIKNDLPEIVFIDIDMPTMNGIELAIHIQTILQNILIIFVTAHSRYAIDAYKVHPIDYILKPINSLYFENTMDYVLKQYQLINSVNNGNIKKNRRYIRTFGNFEVLNENQEIMKFTTKKTKTLLSYIICHVDKTIYRDEILTLFSSSNDNTITLNNYYVTLSRLRSSLSKFGFKKSELFIKKNCAAYFADGVCDLIDFIKFIKNNQVIHENNRVQAEYWINQYHGEVFADIDEDWTNEMKYFIEVEMERLAIKLATMYKDMKQFNLCENVLIKLVDINNYSTQGYDALLDLYILINNNNKYKQTYKKYVKYLKEELNEDIDDYYMKYFKML